MSGEAGYLSPASPPGPQVLCMSLLARAGLPHHTQHSTNILETPNITEQKYTALRHLRNYKNSH